MSHLIKDKKLKQPRINRRSTSLFLSAVMVLVGMFTCDRTRAADTTSFRKGTVNATTLNVRARPGTNFEVVAKLRKGATVRIVAQTEEWYEIIAPSSSEAWCAAHLLAGDGTVAEDGLRVRSGPGIVFSAYHRLEKGTKIKKNDRRVNGWQSIQPPDDATVWVSRQFVDAQEPAPTGDAQKTVTTTAIEKDADEAQSAKPEKEDEETDGLSEDGDQAVADTADEDRQGKTAATPEDETPATETDSEEAPTAGADKTAAERNGAEEDDFSTDAEERGTEFELDEEEGTGEEDDERARETAPKTEPPPPLREGVVIPLEGKQTPFATHILANVKGKKAYPKAYLRSSRIDLTPWEYKSVRVHGKKVQYEGWSRPVFVVRGIERLLE